MQEIYKVREVPLRKKLNEIKMDKILINKCVKLDAARDFVERKQGKID